MASLKERLLSAEDDFLSALVGDEDAMVAFDQHWRLLLDDIDSAIAQPSPDTELLSLAHTVSMRVATLADASAEVYESCNTFTSQLMDDIHGLMSELTLTDPSPSLCQPPHSDASSALHLHRAPVGQSRKRRNTEDEHCHWPTRGTTKRRRTNSISSSTSSADSGSYHGSGFSAFPSPFASPLSPTSSVRAVQDDSSLRKRKRTASDSSTLATPSKSRRLYVGPRLHAVSDSFSSLSTCKAEKRLPSASGHSPSSITKDTIPAVYEVPAVLSDETSAQDDLEATRIANPLPSVSNVALEHCDFDYWSTPLDIGLPPSDLDSLDALLKSVLEPGTPLISLPKAALELPRASHQPLSLDHASSESAIFALPCPPSVHCALTPPPIAASGQDPVVYQPDCDFNLDCGDFPYTTPIDYALCDTFRLWDDSKCSVDSVDQTLDFVDRVTPEVTWGSWFDATTPSPIHSPYALYSSSHSESSDSEDESASSSPVSQPLSISVEPEKLPHVVEEVTALLSF